MTTASTVSWVMAGEVGTGPELVCLVLGIIKMTSVEMVEEDCREVGFCSMVIGPLWLSPYERRTVFCDVGLGSRALEQDLMTCFWETTFLEHQTDCQKLCQFESSAVDLTLSCLSWNRWILWNSAYSNSPVWILWFSPSSTL